MDPSVLHGSWIHHCWMEQGCWSETPTRRNCLSEAWGLYKVTAKVASTELAVLSFGEQILGQENEMWPPPDELPEFRKPHWPIVWSMLGWSDTDLCWSWRGEGWAECHPCLGMGVWMGECWLSMEHFMAACWRKTVCVPSLPLQPCAAILHCHCGFFVMGGRKGERKKGRWARGRRTEEKRCVFYP